MVPAGDAGAADRRARVSATARSPGAPAVHQARRGATHAPELALAPARPGLPITWVTTGQAVPEDIEEPTVRARARARQRAASRAPAPVTAASGPPEHHDRPSSHASRHPAATARRSRRPAVPRRAIAVTGGKGGVGKSTIALNLAIAYAQLGARTLIVDTDLGMADLNLLLGVAPEKSMLDALGGTPIEEVLVAAHGIQLLPALNGSYLLSTIGPAAQRRVLELVELARRAVRHAGRRRRRRHRPGRRPRSPARPTDAIVVVNPEPLSMADAYACLKMLATEQGVTHAFVAAQPRDLARAGRRARPPGSARSSRGSSISRSPRCRRSPPTRWSPRPPRSASRSSSTRPTPPRRARSVS